MIIFFLHMIENMIKRSHPDLPLVSLSLNNTPQAYPWVRLREAQTGGLIICGK